MIDFGSMNVNVRISDVSISFEMESRRASRWPSVVGDTPHWPVWIGLEKSGNKNLLNSWKLLFAKRVSRIHGRTDRPMKHEGNRLCIGVPIREHLLSSHTHLYRHSTTTRHTIEETAVQKEEEFWLLQYMYSFIHPFPPQPSQSRAFDWFDMNEDDYGIFCCILATC